MPVIVLKKVVLPAPFGPIRPAIIPFSITKSTLFTATSPPNALVTLRASKRFTVCLPLFRGAAFNGSGVCSGSRGFVFFSMQLFTNLLAGKQPFGAHSHHNDQRQAKEQKAIQDRVRILRHDGLQRGIERECGQKSMLKETA